jgi:hypothetical protein
MSEFTQQDAESAGWAFVHVSEPYVVNLGDDNFKTVPGVYRAEKYFNGTLQNEVANDQAQLLIQISLYEAHIAQPVLEGQPESPDHQQDTIVGLSTDEPSTVGAERFEQEKVAVVEEAPAEPEVVEEAPAVDPAPLTAAAKPDPVEEAPVEALHAPVPEKAMGTDAIDHPGVVDPTASTLLDQTASTLLDQLRENAAKAEEALANALHATSE